MKKEKIIIIGGGPAGLAAAIYNARADLSPLVIAGSPPGGQLTLTSDVENYPGFESILGPDLIEKMRKHAETFGTRFINDNVREVDFSKENSFKITLSTGETYEAEAILVASGASALWLNLANEQRLRGKGVSACATCDGFFFKNKEVAVVGGGDTAMEEALTLTRFASKVYLIHRRNEFRASKIMQKRVMDHEKIEVMWNTEIVDVLGDQRVEGLITRPNTTDKEEQKTFKVDGLFLAIGHKPNTDFLRHSGVVLNQKGYVVTSGWYAWEQQGNHKLGTNRNEAPMTFDFDYQYATTVKGVFAAGDVVDYIYRQATTAVGMAVAAALEIERYLSEKK